MKSFLFQPELSKQIISQTLITILKKTLKISNLYKYQLNNVFKEFMNIKRYNF